ncbi:Mu transposase C-terminal domain-containing protein [Leptolyngbya sp. NIES-2104]|uniref:Mu transposase C-terminal domain-containing protein n=1 Tax=Leptolyngbya sp. NIES-2104 TaxID=1552121 RepID=UPI0006EC99FF|nr:Mu transposase C-terminal domain-containing protein [Leptolyngbya sp. NIES-2104]GAP96576.1 transposase, putative [Leptolyngbya sp. NIES-2104]
MSEYSTTELVKIIGSSRQAIQKQLKNLPHQKLPGRGGEFVYLFGNLPAIIQEKIVNYEQKNNQYVGSVNDTAIHNNADKNQNKTGNVAKNASSNSQAHVNVFGDPKAEERAEQRVRAWLKIFNLQEEYCYEHKISKIVDQDLRFSEAYNNGKVEIPEWVRLSIPSLSRSNLAKIRSDYKKKKKNALRGNYGNRKGATKLTVEMQELIIRLILYRTPQIREQLEHKLQTDIIPSLRTIDRFKKKWIRDNPQEYALLQGETVFNSNYLSAFGDASAHADYRGKAWEMDATKGDVVVFEVELSDGKRYCLLTIIDVNTRLFHVFVAETASAQSYVIGLRRMIIELGIPCELWVDQGLAEKSHHIQLLCKALDIEFHPCPGKSPWTKPHVERLHRTISVQLLELMDSFCGHNVAERQQIRSREGSTIKIPLSPEQLQKELDAFSYKKAREPHGEGTKGLGGRSPLEVWQDPLQPAIRAVEDERLLDFALAPVPATSGRGPGVRCIGKQGIWVDSRDYASETGACGELIGTWVYCKYDPYDDAGKIWVFDNESREFLFVAYNPELSGKSRQEMAVKRRIKQSEYRKTIKQTKRYLEAKHGKPVLPSSYVPQSDNPLGVPPTLEETIQTEDLEGFKAALEILKPEPSDPKPLTPRELEIESRSKIDPKKELPALRRDDNYFIKLCNQVMAGEAISSEDADWMRRLTGINKGRGLLASLTLEPEDLLAKLDQNAIISAT